MRIILLLFLFFRISSENSQKKLPDLSECPVVNPEYHSEEKSSYTLVVVSGAGCGYCARALNYLLDLDTLKDLEIIIYEFDTLEKIEKMHSKYFKNYLFIQGDYCSAYNPKMLLPTFFLYRESKLVWKHKGQEKSKSNINEIKSFVNNY
jgi:thioredoxin-related protein